jgi:hypothetical protein
MHGSTCVVRASLTPFSHKGRLKDLHLDVGMAHAFGMAGERSPGPYCHSTLALAVIRCQSLRIYVVVLLPMLSFSVKMTASPVARRAESRRHPALVQLRLGDVALAMGGRVIFALPYIYIFK